MLNKVLENVSTIAIGGHVRPDGDCVGSCVGLGQYIRENYSDKTVDIYLKDIPESFHFLNGTETILESVDNEEKIYDLFISLDCGDTDRLEYSKPLFVKSKAYVLCRSSYQQHWLCRGQSYRSGSKFNIRTGIRTAG